MNKHKLCLIYNPAARGEKARLLDSELHFIAQEATILGSKKSGDAESLAAAAIEQGFETIVAAGGDGTVNEVINGIGESKVKLGILPIGTMNVFAHEMGLLLNQIQKCWDIILHGESHLVDLAVANGHFFVQLAGVGLDAQVLKKTDRQMRRIIGPLSYIISAAKIIGHPAPKLIVEIPQRGLNEASFVLIGNGEYYGGPVSVFRDARNDDGLLDVLLFKNLGYLDIIRYLHEILLGTHRDVEDIEYFQTKSIRIVSDQMVPVEIDGEAALETPVQFELTGRRIEVVA